MYNTLEERKELCQNCKSEFFTDSKYHDKYCGCCRSEYYIIIKELKRNSGG